MQQALKDCISKVLEHATEQLAPRIMNITLCFSSCVQMYKRACEDILGCLDGDVYGKTLLYGKEISDEALLMYTETMSWMSKELRIWAEDVENRESKIEVRKDGVYLGAFVLYMQCIHKCIIDGSDGIKQNHNYIIIGEMLDSYAMFINKSTVEWYNMNLDKINALLRNGA